MCSNNNNNPIPFHLSQVSGSSNTTETTIAVKRKVKSRSDFNLTPKFLTTVLELTWNWIVVKSWSSSVFFPFFFFFFFGLTLGPWLEVWCKCLGGGCTLFFLFFW